MSGDKLSPAALARLIELRGHRLARDAAGTLYFYEAGRYHPGGEDFVAAAAKKILLDRRLAGAWSSHRCREAARFLAADAPLLWDRPPLDRVNVLNGILDLQTGTLEPHSPEWLSTTQLPVTYDPKARCPAWEAFLHVTFPRDAVELAWQLAGWLMVPMLTPQKAVLLVGSGANGKSRFINGLQAFLGRSNVCSVSLHDLDDNRFATSLLVNRLAAFCPDLSARDVRSSHIFKAITGGDEVVVERKYVQPISSKLFARFVFATNRPPIIRDGSEAFWRRWLVIPFSRTIAPEDRIPEEELDAELAKPGELSGVLNRAIAGLRQVRAHGDFLQAESLTRAHAEFRRASDPLAAWLDSAVEEDPAGHVARRDLLERFNRWRASTGLPPISAEDFGRQLRRLRPDWPVTQVKGHDGQRVRVYAGLRFVD